MKHLYVHIPFCQHICAYCDFSKVFYKEEWADIYLDALLYEINDKQLRDGFETIYIGGGTPSSLSYNQLERLLNILKPYSSKVIEYSIEVNPESMDEDKIDLLKSYGVNRISIGVQSFHNDLLKTINRHHNSKEAVKLIDLLKQKGIDDINVDLMYGLPGQSIDHIKEDIEYIASKDISHISVYSLILEDHTVLKNTDYQPIDDETDAYIYDYINQTLKHNGYHHYEISNYYKKKPSYHNLSYWYYKDYEGIGLGAHSLKENKRYINTRSLKDYLKHQYLLETEILEHNDHLFEKIMMGLRLAEGINITEINNEYNIDLYSILEEVISKYIVLEMMESDGTFLKVNEAGMAYLNTILVDFLEVLE